MSRTAEDMELHGAQRLRDILANYTPQSAEPSYVSDVETELRSMALGPHFIVTIDGYDYRVTVEFEDPR